jgi:hypothetical protein
MSTCKHVLFAAALGMSAVPAFAGIAAGPVFFHGSFDRYANPPAGTQVKFCVAGVAGASEGRGECYSTTVANGFRITLPDFKSYYFFAWYDAYDWGSDSVPAWTNTNGMTGTVVNFATGAYMNVVSELRPHRPVAVYPSDGGTNIPLVFTLKWTSGIDVDRNWPGVWPVTYDIYAYGEGGTEIKVLSDIPCNADASGNCSYFINNVVPNWRYFWRVVPKIKVTGPGQIGTRIYSQSSQQFTFVTQP